MKRFTLKQLLLSIISAVVALFGILTPVFDVLKVEAVSVSLLKANGFDFLRFKSQFFNNGTYKSLDVITGLIVIVILILAILSVVFSALSFFKKPDISKKFSKTAVILGLVIAVGYFVIGLVDKAMYLDLVEKIGNSTAKEEMAQFLKTGVIAPFVIITVLFIGYFVVNGVLKEGVIKNTSGNPYAKLSEEERLSTLLKYKELLKEEIITNEEFEVKKRELLLLNPTEEKAEVKSYDDDKFAQVAKYKKMFDEGTITEEEFKELKKRILL